MQEDAGAPKRILVVDDEQGMRHGCQRALGPAGYEVDTAANFASGQALIREQEHDLYLLDVMLPDGSGLDLLQLILEQDPLAIGIIITGFGSIEMAVEAVRRGAYDFLAKPFTSDELLVTVGQGLERRRLRAIEVQAQELVRANEELERLDEIKSQLMLKMAHELRAPVAAVQSYVNLMLADYISGEEVQETLARIKERLQETLDITADLLELAQLKQAGPRFATGASPQDMAALLEEVYELFRAQATEKEQDLRLEIEDRPTILADRDHMMQVWTNLISNAIKYTPRGGRILARLEGDEEQLTGLVEDSGMGIAAGEMEQLFQEFYRTDGARASGELGTGLGLSIVKQIVDAYGGSIEVESEPGQGARFVFRLPLKPIEKEPEEKDEPLPGPRYGDSGGPALPASHSRKVFGR